MDVLEPATRGDNSVCDAPDGVQLATVRKIAWKENWWRMAGEVRGPEGIIEPADTSGALVKLVSREKVERILGELNKMYDG